ncbi:hypothetical protein AAHN97_05695 [Chitinophaga niabensis]|uniref:LIC_13387 family protein n=1 Tax=Chitinophaga niabensis TaxID=536979 RepID=UPI0031BA53D2
MARISIILASAILLFFGLLHLQGTFFSTDLHPENIDLVEKLKSSSIQMTKAGNIWKLWIGFNAMFSVGLIFIGSINLYLSAKHFQLLISQRFILLLTILSNAFFVWVGYQYMITGFIISMSIPLLLFVTGFTLIQFKQSKHYA